MKVKVKIVFPIHDGFLLIIKRFSVRFFSYAFSLLVPDYQEIISMQAGRLTLPWIIKSLVNFESRIIFFMRNIKSHQLLLYFLALKISRHV